MLTLVQKRDSHDLALDVREAISAYLYDLFSAEEGWPARLDRWTQKRIAEENLAKAALVFEAEDPREHCYQNLIREIDTEAEMGIYLVRPAAKARHLRRLAKESGVSGRLYQQLPEIAPILFEDELMHSNNNLDIVWVTIEARYDRAYIDAAVSQLVMARILDDKDAAREMVNALRSMLYEFHEDLTRRRTALPLLLNEPSTRDLLLMVQQLAERSGDYLERVTAISERAGTA